MAKNRLFGWMFVEDSNKEPKPTVTNSVNMMLVFLTGMVVLGLLGAGGLMLFYKALPFLITVSWFAFGINCRILCDSEKFVLPLTSC